jgi:hypothetical protein
VFNRRDINTHDVFVVDRVGIGLGHVHAMRHAPSPTKRYQSFGKKILNLLARETFKFDIHTEILTESKFELATSTLSPDKAALVY